MTLTRGSRSDRQSPDEFQNVNEAKESTWDQMMALFLTPCNPSPPNDKVKQNGYKTRGPVDVDTCETRLSHNAKPDTQVVTREQPEGDLLDYVFENVESTVCRGDAETENETNGNELQTEPVGSLRQDNSLISREDVGADMSTHGNSPKPRNGDENFASSRSGEVVRISKQDESEQPEREGDLLDSFFENVESTVCRGDAETENETYGNELQAESIISLRRDNSLIDREDTEEEEEEDISTYGTPPKPRNGHEPFVFWRTGEVVRTSKQDESEGTTKTREPVHDKKKGNPSKQEPVHDKKKGNPSKQDESEGTTKTREPVHDKKKGNPDLLDRVFQNTESFVCGESITPEEIMMNPDEDYGITGACSFRDQDPEPPTYAQKPKRRTKPKKVVESPKVEDEQKSKEGGFDVLDYVFENTESFVCGGSKI
jgi:hypothetical protein